MWNNHQMNVTQPQGLQVNIGSGNGSMPSNNKTLPETMSTKLFNFMSSNTNMLHAHVQQIGIMIRIKYNTKMDISSLI